MHNSCRHYGMASVRLFGRETQYQRTPTFSQFRPGKSSHKIKIRPGEHQAQFPIEVSDNKEDTGLPGLFSPWTSLLVLTSSPSRQVEIASLSKAYQQWQPPSLPNTAQSLPYRVRIQSWICIRHIVQYRASHMIRQELSPALLLKEIMQIYLDISGPQPLTPQAFCKCCLAIYSAGFEKGKGTSILRWIPYDIWWGCRENHCFQCTQNWRYCVGQGCRSQISLLGGLQQGLFVLR